MTEQAIGYTPKEVLTAAINTAEMPEVREEKAEYKRINLTPDDQFIAKLPLDLTPEEIEILDFANNQ